MTFAATASTLGQDIHQNMIIVTIIIIIMIIIVVCHDVMMHADT